MTKRLDFNEDINFDFDVSSSGLNRDINVWTQIFKQEDATFCPILDCKLYEAGNCETNKTPYPSNLLELTRNDQEWTLGVNDVQYNGFTTNYCVYCNNEYQRIWWDNLKITQTERCKESGKLVKKDFRAINAVSWKYNKVATTTKIADSLDLFTNTDPDPMMVAACLIQSCLVYQSDCKTPWNFQDPKKKGFTISDTTPFELSYDSSMIHGYKHDICVKCTNPQMTASNSFSIQQESKCLPSYETLKKRPFVLTPEETTKYEEATAADDKETLALKPTKFKYHYERSFSGNEEPVKGEETT